MKSKRAWLERQHESGSSYTVTIGTGKAPLFGEKGSLELTLADCNRRITWFFGVPGDKRAIRKITKVKALVDEIYEHLTAGASRGPPDV